MGSGGFSYSAVHGFSIRSGRDTISVHSAISVIILTVFNSLTYTNRWCWLLHALLFVAAQGQQGGGSWNNLGSNYSNTYAGGPQRGASNYQQRSTGPYGGKLNHLSLSQKSRDVYHNFLLFLFGKCDAANLSVWLLLLFCHCSLFAFSLHFSSSAFLRYFFRQSSNLSCGLPHFLLPPCFISFR